MMNLIDTIPENITQIVINWFNSPLAIKMENAKVELWSEITRGITQWGKKFQEYFLQSEEEDGGYFKLHPEKWAELFQEFSDSYNTNRANRITALSWLEFIRWGLSAYDRYFIFPEQDAELKHRKQLGFFGGKLALTLASTVLATNILTTPNNKAQEEINTFWADHAMTNTIVSGVEIYSDAKKEKSKSNFMNGLSKEKEKQILDVRNRSYSNPKHQSDPLRTIQEDTNKSEYNYERRSSIAGNLSRCSISLYNLGKFLAGKDSPNPQIQSLYFTDLFKNTVVSITELIYRRKNRINNINKLVTLIPDFALNLMYLWQNINTINL